MKDGEQRKINLRRVANRNEVMKFFGEQWAQYAAQKTETESVRSV